MTARPKWKTEARERANEEARERYARDIEKYAAKRAAKREAANAYAAEYRKRNAPKVKKAADAYYAANKEKWKGYAARRAVRAAEDPEYAERLRLSVLRSRMMRHYGLTLEEYERMVAANKGKCEVCCRPDAKGRRLSVDHNHKTGKIRGVLCRNCNSALGMLADDPECFLRAAAYLKRND